MTGEQPKLSPDFDLDAWIDGTCGVTAIARIVQRGDLIAERARLEDELRVARKIRAEDRGLGDQTPETVQAALDEINRDLYESMLLVTIEDRTSDHRKEVREAATEGISQKEDQVRYNTVALLAEIADSIIKVETADGRELPLGPDGFGWERLERIRERCGEAALLELVDRYREMTSTAPAVQAPFSQSSSFAPAGTTSRRSSKPHGRGASRRA